MSPQLAAIPSKFFVGGHNPACHPTADPNNEGAPEFYGVVVSWPHSSYCGRNPPNNLDLQGTINWINQKTARMPCEEHLSERENLERFQEFKAMRAVLAKLTLKQVQLRIGMIKP